MYVVDSSARKATITLTGEEVAVKFPCTYSVFGIKGDSMLLYPKSGMAQGDDGVYDTAEGDGSVIMCLHYQVDTVYIKGTGDCVIWAGNSTLDNPFSATGKGGGGSSGDNTHYKGTTTTAISNGSTTNPITIDGESYTAVFGDIVVYGYTEFVFDGTTWSEFGRPFDTVPTSGSANAVTSDGIYKRTPLVRGTGANSAVGGSSTSFASSNDSIAYGGAVQATQGYMAAFGLFNKPRNGDLFNVGNGATNAQRSNILEANHTSLNVNGDIQQNGVPLRATTMPTITASMLGKVVQYVGASDSNYNQGWNYVAVSDGAAEPTYRWRALMDSVPTSGSNNPVTSGGTASLIRWCDGYKTSIGLGATVQVDSSVYALGFGEGTHVFGNHAVGLGYHLNVSEHSMFGCGRYNRNLTGSLFEIGNGTANNARSNIVEVNYTSMNVNGDIKCHNLVVPVGGYEETVLWTGDQSSAPSEIEISEAYTNFDALFFKTRTTTTTSEDYISAYILASAYGIGEFFQILGYANSGYRYVWYKFTDATHLERGMTGDLYMRKIVGIKYPKLYVPPVSLNQSPATLLTNQTEEPTDEMR